MGRKPNTIHERRLALRARGSRSSRFVLWPANPPVLQASGTGFQKPLKSFQRIIVKLVGHLTILSRHYFLERFSKISISPSINRWINAGAD